MIQEFEDANDAVMSVLTAAAGLERGKAEDLIEDLLKAHAHGLAEAIRDRDNAYGPITAQVAADHIDLQESDRG